MPLVDCEKLLQAKKLMQPKVLAEALVNHVLPKVVDLEKEFLERINKGLPAEVPIFTYQSTELLVNGSTPIEGFFINTVSPSRTVASLAYDVCDRLPCGTTIGKAVAGWAALELLSTALGPNIRVYKHRGEKCDYNSRPEFNAYFYTLVARLEKKPLTRSLNALTWWPHADRLTVENGKVVWPDASAALPAAAPLPANDERALRRAERLKAEVAHPTEMTADIATEIYDDDDDRYDDQECTYCGEMESICGGDHGDDMRWEQLQRRSRGRSF